MNSTVKQYLGSLMNDVSYISTLCDDELIFEVCGFVLNESIDVLTDIKHHDGNHNGIVDNKINFLKEVLKELQDKTPI